MDVDQRLAEIKIRREKLQEEFDRVMDIKHSTLSPDTMILTVYDLEFLEKCGISTKGMLLGEWK